MSSAAFHDIAIEQGKKFELTVQALNSDKTVKNLTGYDARMQVRPTVTSATILVSATTSNGLITINAPGGLVMIRIGADLTAPLTFNSAVYDLEIYKAADLTEVIGLTRGFVSLIPEVTR